ncbi:glutathione S-transferase [Vibrio cidicii]|uniref:glutathione S-transferase family protein n=1 Tax=Vibrio cidicii TaxID=1763883 RepID=UPI0018C29220|nr:glutathione S-transferase family protein [Vibrio cidicii]MBG0759231.1 glutathione S-transferase [Vibrio cidicii]
MDVILYSAKGSNSSERVEWVLHYKQIAYRRIEVSSEALAGSYLNINPFGYVPALSVDGEIFSESMAIIEYLEESGDNWPLLGRTRIERAHVRRVCEYVNASIHSPQNRTVLTFWRPELGEREKRVLRGQWIMRCLDKLRATLCCDSGYAIGHHFSLADIFVASIYKKARQHGCVEDAFYRNHLLHLRADKKIAESEPRP